MTPAQLEKRLALVEAELARLKRKVEATDTSMPWWERIAGTFQNDPVYAQAMRLGQQYRRSQKSRATARKRKT